MRRSVAPWIVLALIGVLAGWTYRYFAEDPNEASVANYLRSGVHGMGLALSGWAVHLAPAGRLFRRHRERRGTVAGILQGGRPRAAGLRRVHPGSELVVEALGPTQLRGRAAAVEVFALERRGMVAPRHGAKDRA